MERALAKSPSDRWSNAEDFGAALNACATGELRFTSSGPRYWWRRPNRRAAMVTIAAGVVAASAFAWSAQYREPVARGQRAIADWDFDRAKAELSNAVSRRQNDARAQLWLAQTMMLSGDSVPQWKPLVAFASDNRGQRRTASNIWPKACCFFPDHPAPACKEFQQVAKREGMRTPLGITASLSYADCLAEDRSVVPDAASPSRYRYNVSLQLVDSLYEALLERNQSPNGYRVLVPRIQDILRVDRGRVRSGFWRERTGLYSWHNQVLCRVITIAYFPFPSFCRNAVEISRPSGVNRQIVQSRKIIRGFALDWFVPRPSRHLWRHETLTRILELTGKLDRPNISALAKCGRQGASLRRTTTEFAVRSALRLPKSDSISAKINFKSGRFRRHRSLVENASDS